jgi:hypothetical protein
MYLRDHPGAFGVVAVQSNAGGKPTAGSRRSLHIAATIVQGYAQEDLAKENNMFLHDPNRGVSDAIDGSQNHWNGWRKRIARSSLAAGLAVLLVCWMPASVSFAQGPATTPKRSPDEIERLRRDVEHAEGPWKAGPAYEALFTKLKLDGLRPLINDKNTSIALQAAWEVHRNVVERKPPIPGRTDWVFSEKEVDEFIKSLSKGTGSVPPEWWSMTLRRGDVFPGSHHCFIDKPKGDPAHATPTVLKDGVVIMLGGKSIKIPKALCDKALESATERDFTLTRVAALLEKERSYIAIYPLRAYSYRLLCLDPKTGDALWTVNVWGCRKGVSFGAPDFDHQVEIRRQGNNVLVYGKESGMYLEAFDVKTGANLFRFCTNYWCHFSEKWDLDGR